MVKLVVNGMNYLYGCFLVVEYSNSARMYFKRVKMGSKKEILLTQISQCTRRRRRRRKQKPKKGGEMEKQVIFFGKPANPNSFFFSLYKRKG